MKQINTIPRRDSAYPCYEVHKSGIVLWTGYSEPGRWLTFEQFAKEFPGVEIRQPAEKGCVF